MSVYLPSRLGAPSSTTANLRPPTSATLPRHGPAPGVTPVLPICTDATASLCTRLWVLVHSSVRSSPARAAPSKSGRVAPSDAASLAVPLHTDVPQLDASDALLLAVGKLGGDVGVPADRVQRRFRTLTFQDLADVTAASKGCSTAARIVRATSSGVERCESLGLASIP